MSVANPWMVSLPAPLMSHSDGGLPGFEFSQTIGFAIGGSHGAATAAGALITTLSVALKTAVAANATTHGTKRCGKRRVAGPRCLAPRTDREDGSTKRTPRQSISEAPQIVTCIAGRISATSEPPTLADRSGRSRPLPMGRNIPSPPEWEHRPLGQAARLAGIGQMGDGAIAPGSPCGTSVTFDGWVVGIHNCLAQGAKHRRDCSISRRPCP